MLSGHVVNPFAVTESQCAIVESFMGSITPPLYVDSKHSEQVGYSSIYFKEPMYKYRYRKDNTVRYGVAQPKALGAGAFGSIYKITHSLSIKRGGNVVCKQKSEEKQYVVKVYTGATAHDNAEYEFEMLSKIPGWRLKVPQHSMGQSTLFMSYIPGITLQELITAHQNGTKPLTVQQRLVLSRNLFAALQEQVHQNGLVHRDIKPANVMVGPDGKITIVDFNLAKLATHNDAGEKKATPIYAAPEVFGIQSTGIECDVYSMGRALWQLWDWGVKNYEGADMSELTNRFEYYSKPDGRNYIPYLFSNTSRDELTLAELGKIHNLLLQINHKDQRRRPMTAAIIAEFDAILGERVDHVIPNVTNTLTASSFEFESTIGIQQEDSMPVINLVPHVCGSNSQVRFFQPAIDNIKSEKLHHSLKGSSGGCVIC